MTRVRQCSCCRLGGRAGALAVDLVDGIDGLVEVGVCASCDRRRCDRCRAPERTGSAERCERGADLRLGAGGGESAVEIIESVRATDDGGVVVDHKVGRFDRRFR